MVDKYIITYICTKINYLVFYMAQSANTFNSLQPIYKESYSDTKKNKKKEKESRFSKIRAKLLKDWKPKKVGM